MTTEPLDNAAIMAAHYTIGDWAHDGGEFCAECSEVWPCEPYRLAEQNADLQAAVDRVRALHNGFHWCSAGLGIHTYAESDHPCPTTRALAALDGTE